MNATHLHLMFTRIPVLGPVFGLGLLAKERRLKKAALGTFRVVALRGCRRGSAGRCAEPR